jgi:hypothetical protein
MADIHILGLGGGEGDTRVRGILGRVTSVFHSDSLVSIAIHRPLRPRILSSLFGPLPRTILSRFSPFLFDTGGVDAAVAIGYQIRERYHGNVALYLVCDLLFVFVGQCTYL